MLKAIRDILIVAAGIFLGLWAFNEFLLYL